MIRRSAAGTGAPDAEPSAVAYGASMTTASTGIPELDRLVGGLRVGDNVLWQVGHGTSADPFVSAFVQEAGDTPGLVYVSLHVPPAAILDRFGDAWDPERFLLVDLFTHGVGGGDPAFVGFRRSARGRGVQIRTVRHPADAASTLGELAEIEHERGRRTRYVFDSLTGMEALWGREEALACFLRSCPRLYELDTVAYWLAQTEAHDRGSLSRLIHVTQLALDLRVEGGEPRLKVLKAAGRPPEVLGRDVGYAFEGGRMRIVEERVDERERAGRDIRARRIARGLSQAELARRLGISPSALSQAERGRAALSARTHARAREILEPPSPVDRPSAERPPYVVSRRGGRPSRALRPGLSSELLQETADGAAFHLLEFAPGASGRLPPFPTKHEEIAVLIDGVLELRVGQATESLQAGDAIRLASEPVAAWRNPSAERARAIWAILP